MLKMLRNNFLTGLLVILPILVTVWLLIWGFKQTDAILGGLFPRKIPGLGLVTLIVVISLVGMFSRIYIGKKLISFGEGILSKIPILRGIYALIKQITESFANTEKSAFHKVVLIRYPGSINYSVGFLTGEAPAECSAKKGEKLLSIFIPTTPNITTGFLVFVPEEEATFLDMSIEEGIKFILSVGVIKPK